jgi:hypothetical protein
MLDVQYRRSLTGIKACGAWFQPDAPRLRVG